MDSNRPLGEQLIFIPKPMPRPCQDDPSPEQIRAMTRKFIDSWDEDTERKRRTGDARMHRIIPLPVDTSGISGMVPTPEEPEN